MLLGRGTTRGFPLGSVEAGRVDVTEGGRRAVADGGRPLPFIPSREELELDRVSVGVFVCEGILNMNDDGGAALSF